MSSNNFENNKYIYNYTDHLGNVRLISYTKNGLGTEIIEENNFYPFGLKHEGYNAVVGNPSYNYQYNGKELQKETGWSDYGARMYMADIGRWGVIDPLAETSRRFTPYNYAYNNPISFIDPDGRKAESPDQVEANIFKLNAPEDSFWWSYAKGSPVVAGSGDNIGDFFAQMKSSLGIESGGGGISASDVVETLQQIITTLNYVFQFGEWDYVYTEKKGMMKGTKGAEFSSESMLDNNPYNNKYFETDSYEKVNNIVAGLNLSITIVKLENGEYKITEDVPTTKFSSSAYDANADGKANISYLGKGKGFLNIQFQISNKEQAIQHKVGKIDGKVNVKDSHTALMTVSYPFNIVENRGQISMQFGRPTNYKAYNLNTLMIAEGIRYIPLTKFEFLGPPIQTRDYNYQIKKK